jgi:hypothetical protein
MAAYSFNPHLDPNAHATNIGQLAAFEMTIFYTDVSWPQDGGGPLKFGFPYGDGSNGV